MKKTNNNSPNENKVLFGEIIQKALKNSRISQAALSDMLGVSRNTVNNWVADKYKPEHELIVKLCDILGLTLNELYGKCGADDLSPAEKTIINNYRLLSSTSQNAVVKIVSDILDEELAAEDKYLREHFVILEAPKTKAAAGQPPDKRRPQLEVAVACVLEIHKHIRCKRPGPVKPIGVFNAKKPVSADKRKMGEQPKRRCLRKDGNIDAAFSELLDESCDKEAVAEHRRRDQQRSLADLRWARRIPRLFQIKAFYLAEPVGKDPLAVEHPEEVEEFHSRFLKPCRRCAASL